MKKEKEESMKTIDMIGFAGGGSIVSSQEKVLKVIWDLH